MTMRQWYKGQAMKGLLANPKVDQEQSYQAFSETCAKYANSQIAEDEKCTS
jgi:hypothetical protein